ncbi:helix-turn-helix domain-containing protein [Arthrobacter sp.]|uniref:helix-turn-helix domain-containing protein n=1 Tax=Arthrobacter sp. TaxID=1667 RepID=UPI003A94707C
MPVPLPPEKHHQIVELAEQGHTRNDIARTVGCSGSTVSRYVKDAGLSFARETTAAATAARQIDQRAVRTKVNATILDQIQEALRQTAQSTTDPRAFQAFAQATASLAGAHDKLARLNPPEEDQNIEAMKEALAGFLLNAQVTARQLTEAKAGDLGPQRELDA